MSRPRRDQLTLPPTVRPTAQRLAVLQAIDATRGGFTPLELFDRVRRDHPGIGLATVYRTVDLLREAGSVRRLPASDAYVRCHPGHHHHLVCLNCGSVEDTELCAAPPAAELKRKHGFAPETHDLDIYGTCARCQAA